METLAESCNISEAQAVMREQKASNVSFLPELMVPVKYLGQVMTFFPPGLLGLLQLTSNNIVRTEDGCGWFLTSSDMAGFEQHEDADDFDSTTASYAGEC